MLDSIILIWSSLSFASLSISSFSIARALSSHPKLLLADEPTAALDSVTGREIVDLLKKLAINHSCAVLIVTHDQRILDVADRLLEMEDGQLLPTLE